MFHRTHQAEDMEMMAYHIQLHMDGEVHCTDTRVVCCLMHSTMVEMIESEKQSDCLIFVKTPKVKMNSTETTQMSERIYIQIHAHGGSRQNLDKVHTNDHVVQVTHLEYHHRHGRTEYTVPFFIHFLPTFSPLCI